MISSPWSVPPARPKAATATATSASPQTSSCAIGPTWRCPPSTGGRQWGRTRTGSGGRRRTRTTTTSRVQTCMNPLYEIQRRPMLSSNYSKKTISISRSRNMVYDEIDRLYFSPLLCTSLFIHLSAILHFSGGYAFFETSQLPDSPDAQNTVSAMMASHTLQPTGAQGFCLSLR